MLVSHLHPKFHVITVVSNPVRYASRGRLYRDFEKHMACSGANLWTVETAFGDRTYELTEAADPRDVRFRTFHELWHKENMINLAIARLPSDWEYVAWIDADVLFHRRDWVTETIQQLQHYQVVQLFGHAIDLDPKGHPMQEHQSFLKAYIDKGFRCPNPKRAEGPCDYYYGGYGKRGSFAHPGYAWAARREAIESLGGLIDWAILGSGDHHMAMALIGESERTFPDWIHHAYARKILRWENRALRYVQRDIGFVPGTISHFWHGKKRDRQYSDRWKILLDNKYNPDVDLMRDSQGLYALTENNARLRDEIRAYFRARNEDSIDL